MQVIIDFFKGLVRSRTSSAQARVKGKIYSVQAQAKGKAASKFNAAVDKPGQALQAKIKGQKGGGQKAGEKAGQAAQGEKKGGAAQDTKQGGEKGMGFFGKKKSNQKQAPQQQRAQQAAVEQFSESDKTQMVNVSEIMDDRAQDCVGWIVALGGAHRGHDFRLVTGRNVIGTAADCDIVLTDAYLSSKHAAIRHENGRFTLIDLDSTNGTYLNDRRISKEELIDNDKIRLGRTELKFKSLY